MPDEPPRRGTTSPLVTRAYQRFAASNARVQLGTALAPALARPSDAATFQAEFAETPILTSGKLSREHQDLTKWSLLVSLGDMTETKRPYLLDSRIEGLRAYLRKSFLQSPAKKHPALDAYGEALYVLNLIAEGDRKGFAVYACLFKLALFRNVLPDLEQRPTDDPRRFEVVNAKTGEVLSDDAAGAGLPELVCSPKGRWIVELHISTVMRLHRVGFTNMEIAQLLPSGPQRTTADIKRDSKAIGAVVRKYGEQPGMSLPDIAYTPANWSRRVQSRLPSGDFDHKF